MLQGKRERILYREYELISSTFDKWVKQANISGSLKEKEYSISAMCKVLYISRSTYYYQGKETIHYSEEAKLEEAVEDVFQQNRRAYSSRRNKEYLDKKQLILSRRKIRRIMNMRKLRSSYTKPKYRVHSK